MPPPGFSGFAITGVRSTHRRVSFWVPCSGRMTQGCWDPSSQALALMLADRGIRVNVVAPGPVWTPLVAATTDPEKLSVFGADTPLGRPAQPAELAGSFVFLASADASYITGAVLPVTGGQLFG